MNKRNKVAIGICTRNRPKKCLSLLRSLSKNKRVVDTIIIIEDVSDRQYLSQELIKKIFKKNTQTKIIYKSVTYQNVANSRNLVLETAKNKFLIFVDDDVCITKNSIEKTITVLEQNKKNAIVIGLLKPKIRNFVSIADSVYYNRERLSLKRKDLIMAPFSFTGINLDLIKKNQISFDKKCINLAGEDIDFCLQVIKKDLKIIFDAAIVNFHFFDTNLFNFLTNKYGYGPYIYQLCKKHPQHIFLSYYISTRRIWKLFPSVSIFLKSIRTFSYSRNIKMPLVSRIILFMTEYTVNKAVYDYFSASTNKLTLLLS